MTSPHNSAYGVTAATSNSIYQQRSSLIGYRPGVLLLFPRIRLAHGTCTPSLPLKPTPVQFRSPCHIDRRSATASRKASGGYSSGQQSCLHVSHVAGSKEALFLTTSGDTFTAARGEWERRQPQCAVDPSTPLPGLSSAYRPGRVTFIVDETPEWCCHVEQQHGNCG